MSYEFTAPPKDPAAVLDHAMDWSAWLNQGETITAQSVQVEPAGLTIGAVGRNNATVGWRVSGGALGQGYVVTCRITTSTGRIDERSVRYSILDR